METGQTGVARPMWYDRNMLSRCISYTATVAPHAQVNRWQYTVPSAKKSILDLILALTFRVTVAAPVGIFEAFIVITDGQPVGSYASSLSLDNTVGAYRSANLNAQTPLVAGDVVQGATRDLSTGGTVTYYVSMHYGEFDA